MSFIYLASPYSDPSTKIIHDRYAQVMKATAFQMELGHTIYSPIVHCHEMAKECNLPKDIKFWWKHNQAMLGAASGFWILTLDGWNKSKEIRKEAQLAIKLQLPIKYITLLEAIQEDTKQQ